MSEPTLLHFIRALLAQPTAPFHEDAVRGEILQQLAQIPGVTATLDDFGNVIAHYRRGAAPGPWAFAAHMDHPAYVSSTGTRAAAAPPGEGWEFLGGVPQEYREKNPPIRDFGAFAMWDLPACEFRDGRVYSRACDDLIGCAAILALFRALADAEAEAEVFGLFTRAEEVGFIGAIQLAKSERIPREATIVSLECSSERSPGAGKMGDGVIVRVGDRTAIFDDAATAQLTRAATEAGIAFQRCLMSGGTCEATAYQLYGYRCAALCVALGNYHNCGPETTIAPEFVALADVEGMVALMLRVAGGTAPAADAHAALRDRLEQRVEEHRRYF